MKNVLWIIVLLMGFLNQMDAQEKIEFSGKKITINGWATNLIISGHDKSFVSIEAGVDNETKLVARHKKGENELEISLKEETKSVHIYIPENTDLNIAMEAVMWEGSFDREKDWRNIKIENTNGELEFDGDGYHVDLNNVNGSIAVVTYGNINADFADLSKSEVISLDTYLGNVEVGIPASTSANLTMRAKGGEVKIDPNLKISETTKKSNKKLTTKLNGGTIPIILHSEGGAYVSLKAN